ncbi:alkaline phosphatase [Plakobranchus ocellatus]|uniref:alkaline phosphatase n=1 Tax=Plakobranchus ocellatus TaxID=259542 RepID=A0AAV4B3G2_9GAST|nr:alkaline phosphatase [Plakobranchus ocellatus]
MALLLAVVMYVWLVLPSLHAASAPTADNYAHEKDPNFWYDLAEKELQATLRAKQQGVAKNVIMFLGDGMGVSTVTGGRIWAGQRLGLYGEEHLLSWDKFPFVGLSKTYNVDRQTTDSAASGTAFLCGIKTRQGMLGLNAHAMRGNCSKADGNEVECILNWALTAGKSVGLVSTARITHATPAAAYAKTPERNWETDRDIPESEKKCKDVAYQLIMQNPRIQVLLGGGRSFFLPEGVADPDPDPSFAIDDASRTDGLNLVEEWKKEKRNNGFTHSYVYNRDGFDRVNPDETDYLLGLFNQEHMQYEAERNKTKEPPIADMAAKAIRILRRNPNGYFLLVEGGRIDHANHKNHATKAFAEVEAMDRAVQVAKELTSDRDTLIVVTADHSHVLGIAGYASRGNPITGLSVVDGEIEIERTDDNKPYTTIVYGNGPGWTADPRRNLTKVDTTVVAYTMDAAVPMSSETHGGEDVAIYATGPQSFLFTGTHEQNYIPFVMAYASCIGPYAKEKLACAKYEIKEKTRVAFNDPDAASLARRIGSACSSNIVLPSVEILVVPIAVTLVLPSVEVFMAPAAEVWTINLKTLAACGQSKRSEICRSPFVVSLNLPQKLSPSLR